MASTKLWLALVVGPLAAITIGAIQPVAAENAAKSDRAAAQAFSAGLSAYNLHNYAVALARWWSLAEKGHQDSQAALGYMYLNGLGVAQDDGMAAALYANAAARGQVDAQHFLGTLYLRGRGVKQDYARAHVLCELAMTRGAALAFHCRDEAIAHLDAEQLDKNYRRVAELYQIFESRNGSHSIGSEAF